MKKIAMCVSTLATLVLAGCGNGAGHESVSVVLQPEKGEGVTLHVPRGYIEEPKSLEGVITHVILRTPAKDFSGTDAFAAESEVRMLIEPASGKADAAQDRLAAALRRPRPSEDAIEESKDKSKPGLIVYSYRNGKENAEAYYFTSASGDVFVECWKAVCKAFKTWDKRVHLRFDYQPVQPADVQPVDESIDRMLRSFATQANATP